MASHNFVIISSGYGLAPVQCQAISLTNADIQSIVPLVKIFIEIWIKNMIFIQEN